MTPSGVLFAGNHRYEAFLKLGIEECLMHVAEPESLDREAIELNVASEDALPMSFVDYAELVWRKLRDGATQQAVADEFGWSRSYAARYAALNNIYPEAWAVVTASMRAVTTDDDEAGTATVPTGTFSERLLRSIISLTRPQQIELVRLLARGKTSKGHKFGKADFKTGAERYGAYNALVEAATSALAERMPAQRAEKDARHATEQLKQRAYIVEHLELGKPGPKFAQLIQSYIDAYEEALNSRIICERCRQVRRGVHARPVRSEGAVIRAAPIHRLHARSLPHECSGRSLPARSLTSSAC